MPASVEPSGTYLATDVDQRVADFLQFNVTLPSELKVTGKKSFCSKASENYIF